MANSINNYGIDGIGVYDKYSNKLINSDEKKSSTLGQSDFLKLIVEQMKNQDFNNTTDNNEFISQMAQFSSLEAMQNLTNYSNLSYGTSLVGKYVTVKTGDEDYVTGLVDCVAVDGGKYSLVINGKEYPSSGVVEVITKEVFDRLQQAENEENKDNGESGIEEATKANASADAAVQARIDKLMEEYEKATSELYAELQKSIEEIKAEVFTDESPVMTEATVNAYNYAGTRVDVVQSNVRSAAPDSYSVSTSNAAAGISESYSNVNSTGVTEDYQLCLKRAKETGTRMAAPQYIFNTSITSKIDTSTVLGRTESGRAFTDIGFSGVGRLGEVVTWADGTQRVEVISPFGYSVYFTTSGEHTLDEICNFDCAPGQYAGEFNGNELAIRYYSRAYTAAEKEAMESFENNISQMKLVKNTEI